MCLTCKGFFEYYSCAISDDFRQVAVYSNALMILIA